MDLLFWYAEKVNLMDIESNVYFHHSLLPVGGCQVREVSTSRFKLVKHLEEQRKNIKCAALFGTNTLHITSISPPSPLLKSWACEKITYLNALEQPSEGVRWSVPSLTVTLERKKYVLLKSRDYLVIRSTGQFEISGFLSNGTSTEFLLLNSALIINRRKHNESDLSSLCIKVLRAFLRAWWADFWRCWKTLNSKDLLLAGKRT